MNKKQLIEILSEYPDDMEVLIGSPLKFLRTIVSLSIERREHYLTYGDEDLPDSFIEITVRQI